MGVTLTLIGVTLITAFVTLMLMVFQILKWSTLMVFRILKWLTLTVFEILKQLMTLMERLIPQIRLYLKNFRTR